MTIHSHYLETYAMQLIITQCKLVWVWVYWEITEDITSAISREKQLKNWHKEWKLNLIKSVNPNYQDLSTLPNYRYSGEC